MPFYVYDAKARREAAASYVEQMMQGVEPQVPRYGHEPSRFPYDMYKHSNCTFA